MNGGKEQKEYDESLQNALSEMAKLCNTGREIKKKNFLLVTK